MTNEDPTTPFAPVETLAAMFRVEGTTLEVSLPAYRFNGVHLTPGQRHETTMLARVVICGPAVDEERPNELENPEVH